MPSKSKIIWMLSTLVVLFVLYFIVGKLRSLDRYEKELELNVKSQRTAELLANWSNYRIDMDSMMIAEFAAWHQRAIKSSGELSAEHQEFLSTVLFTAPERKDSLGNWTLYSHVHNDCLLYEHGKLSQSMTPEVVATRFVATMEALDFVCVQYLNEDVHKELVAEYFASVVEHYDDCLKPLQEVYIHHEGTDPWPHIREVAQDETWTASLGTFYPTYMLRFYMY